VISLAEHFVSLSTVSLRLIKQPEHRPEFEKQLEKQLRETLSIPKTVVVTTMPDSPTWWQRAKTIAKQMEEKRKFEEEHPECSKSPHGKHEWRFGTCVWCGTEATEVKQEEPVKVKVGVTWEYLVEAVEERPGFVETWRELIKAPSEEEAKESAKRKHPSATSVKILWKSPAHVIEEKPEVFPRPWVLELERPLPEAVVKEEEIPTFTPAFLSEVEKAWKEKKSTSFWDWLIEPVENRGVYVTLRGATKAHEFFPKEIIERMRYDASKRVYVVESYV